MFSTKSCDVLIRILLYRGRRKALWNYILSCSARVPKNRTIDNNVKNILSCIIDTKFNFFLFVSNILCSKNNLVFEISIFSEDRKLNLVGIFGRSK